MTTKESEELINKAKFFLNNSYVPFSSIPQGACVLTEDNLIFGGCNIENSDYGASLTACEVAIIKAVSEGHTNLKAVAIYSNSNTLPYLSGNARQLIWQFSKNLIVIVANNKMVETYNIFEMLPYAYEGDE